MLDIHHHGQMDRRSAEAPLQIFDKKKSDFNPGGAANVAVNLKTLECNVFLVGITSQDEYARILVRQLQQYGIPPDGIFSNSAIPTTQKERFYVDGKQVFRSDTESRQPYADRWMQEEMAAYIESLIKEQKPDALVLQDYDKGLFNAQLIEKIMQYARWYKLPVLVDPKLEHFFEYKNVQLLKPNLKELSQALQQEIIAEKSVLDAVVQPLMQQQGIANMLVTLSEKGIYFNDGRQSGILPGFAVEQADVSGAGDTVTAVAAALWNEGNFLEEIARKANHGGAIVCAKKGVQPLLSAELFSI